MIADSWTLKIPVFDYFLKFPRLDVRLHKLLVDKNGKNSQAVEIQASKRQKLEGGHLFKVYIWLFVG